MSDCMSQISESVHGSHDEAINKLWKYVAGDANSKGAIEEKCLDEFIEAIGDNEFDIRLFDFTGDDDEPITSEELRELFSKTSIETKEEVIDWYFNFMDDDNTEAAYRITEFEIA